MRIFLRAFRFSLSGFIIIFQSLFISMEKANDSLHIILNLLRNELEIFEL